MISLQAVASYLPSQSVPIRSMQDDLGLTDAQIKVFERFYGLSHILRDPDGTVADLMLAAAGKLDALRGREHLVKYVIQARTMPVIAPYPVNPIHDVRALLGLEHAEAFAVHNHACASGLLAVELSGRLLATDGDPDALALIFTGEKTFTPAAQTVPGTAVNGEGSAAILVGLDGDRDRVLSYATHTDGRFSAGLSLSDEAAAEFQQIYPETLAAVLNEAVEKAGLTLGDLALVLPHNVNRVSWVRLCKLIGLPLERVFLDNVPVTGHCFCADPFLNYQSAKELGRLQPGDHYLMAAVGLGATFSAMVFQH